MSRRKRRRKSITSPNNNNVQRLSKDVEKINSHKINPTKDQTKMNNDSFLTAHASISTRVGLNSKYYIGIDGSTHRYASSSDYISLRQTLAKLEKLDSVRPTNNPTNFFIFNHNGIQVYPHAPMIASKSDGEFYYIDTKPQLDKNQHTEYFYELDQAILQCSKLGSRYNIYNQFNNRVY